MRCLFFFLLACKHIERPKSLLVAIAYARTTICPSDQVYAKITKVTKSWASEESFKILNGESEFYASPSFEDNSERVLETCLGSPTNNIYSLHMYDSGGDSWSDGAWISIEGINGNLVFKQMMTAGSIETYQFSLYYPINKGDTWKYNANASGSWTLVYYNDEKWEDVVTGVTKKTAMGTQYFRHLFTGAADFAAIEMQLNYRYGVIAYINGVEIYRDHMPEGDVTASTTSTGEYQEIAYHGLIRPADLVEDPTNVLAVELHYPTSTYWEVIQFNGFLSMLVGITDYNRCFVLPQDPVITSKGFTSAEKAWDWTRNANANSTIPDSYIKADFSSVAALGHVNGLRLWPSSRTTSSIHTFIVSGTPAESEPFSEMFRIEGAVYEASHWKQWTRVIPADRYNVLQVMAKAAQSTSMDLYELQLMVCTLPLPTEIKYKRNRPFIKDYQPIHIRPEQYGFANCKLNGTLPAGLVWDSATCSVSGIATESQGPAKIFTVTTMVGTTEISGEFSLHIYECDTSVYKIVRSYKTSPENEYFRIYRSDMEVVYEVVQGHSHSASSEWVDYWCPDSWSEEFQIVFYHTGNYWMEGSYFYMYYLLPDNEQELVAKGRFDHYAQVLNAQFLQMPNIEHSRLWEYKFDSVPENWFEDDSTGWKEASRGNFPPAVNKIQLYKRSFLIDYVPSKGLALSIRYKYGCVVYVNGHEAWRNGVTGEVTDTPMATNVYPDLKYRVVTLPGKSIPTPDQPTSIEYIHQGKNVVAIALIAMEDSQTTVDFDTVIRVMSISSESHLWEFQTGSTSGMTGSYLDPFSQYYGNSVYEFSNAPCTSNSLEFTLANDRREWISSVHIQSYYMKDNTYNPPTEFRLYARNKNTEEWTLLKEVEGLTWSLPGQRRKIYLQNNISYNQFKFENIFPANHAKQCKWRLQSLDLLADNPMDEPAPLSYGEKVEMYKDIEMSEIIPTGDGYFDFSVSPSLPEGIVLDPQTGWISGTPTDITAPTTYTITARKFTGGTVTATINLSVDICAITRSLMTVRFRADPYPEENSWTLYQGRGTWGKVLQEVETFPVGNAYYYVDFCLINGLYTLEGRDSFGDGWQFNTGYTLTADIGAMELEIQELHAKSNYVVTTTVFSTYFPFQTDYTEWKVNQSGFAEGWTGVAFDDSTWTTMKAAEIPITEQITTYIRKTFTITNIADYQVLNIRLKYTGGVAAYFNGNRVGLINMVEDFDDTTESIEVHDITKDAKFHVILPTAGMVEGTNVIAFEVHRPKGTASSEPVVFDATGVFGVESCSVVVDSYSLVESSELMDGTIEGILDLDPFTTGMVPNAVDTFIEWTVDNRLGSKWNAFNIHMAGSVTSWGFRIYGTPNPEIQNPDNIVLFQKTELTVDGRTRPNFEVPAALGGFRRYRWEVIDTASANYAMNAMFMVYCKAKGAICPAIDNYPSVGEGQISPSACPAGYDGYSYRECKDSVLGEVKMDHCHLKPPMNARYSRTFYQFVRDTKVSTGVPTVEHIVTRWYMDSGIFLPDGLLLDPHTGEITGVPVGVMEATSYTIYAENESGMVSAVITLSIRVGQCKAEGVFPVTEVNQVVVYECATKGAYVGTMKRVCKLGAVDGEWQKISGLCMSIALIVILIVIAVVLVVALFILVLRSTRKAKAVGGVKGKKSSKPAHSANSKKTSNKITKI